MQEIGIKNTIELREWTDSEIKIMRETYKDGDWVFGIGPNKGCSPVFMGGGGDLQPFSYLNDYTPEHFRLATAQEIKDAINV